MNRGSRVGVLATVCTVQTVCLVTGAWGYVEQRLMLPMSDGVRLDTHVVRPDGAGPWPAMLYRTPYYELDDPGVFAAVSINYAVVAQNARGRFASEGENKAFFADGWTGHADGLDTVNWILIQPWCNGKICTYGGSARGITQNLLAGANPPNLYAQYIIKAGANMYDGVVYFGGAFRYEMVTNWLTGNAYDPASLNEFVAHPSYDTFWAGYDMTARQNLRNYPVVNISGWYDCFQQCNIDNFTSIREHGGPLARDQAKLVITMSTHGGNDGALPFPANAQNAPPQYAPERMMDHYLKDVANGFDTLPRVAYYMMGDLENLAAPGNEWRYADDWPVPAVETPVYFRSNHTLSLAPPDSAEPPISYDYDPENPVPTLGGANLTIARGNHDQRPVESRPDVVLFDSGPLSVPVEVTGRIWAYLYVSSDALDTDFTAKLTDVYLDGKSILICDGIRRARYRNSQTTPQLMTPDTIYQIPIDLWSTAATFDRGHHVRVTISSSNSPRFAPNPNTGGPFILDDPTTQVAHNTIYVDSHHTSHIMLPLTGPDSDSDNVFDILDPFPDNPDEWADADHDGLGDNFEQRIIDFNPDDPLETLEDVRPEDDFDHDLRTNLQEFQQGTDPTAPDQVPAAGFLATVLLTGVTMLCATRRLKSLAH